MSGGLLTRGLEPRQVQASVCGLFGAGVQARRQAPAGRGRREGEDGPYGFGSTLRSPSSGYWDLRILGQQRSGHWAKLD